MRYDERVRNDGSGAPGRCQVECQRAWRSAVGALAPRLCWIAIASAASAAHGQTPPAPKASPFDGRWAVSLVCPDVRDKQGAPVTGYIINLFATVKDGHLAGQDGKPGQPGSMAMAGRIEEDGSAEITVNGLTGGSEYSIGRIPPGSPYGYRMRGTFTPAGGKAVRTELRPCEATFFRE